MKWTQKNYVDKAPIWWQRCHLRDGNQALIIPMSLGEKLEFFKKLVDIGFKEMRDGLPRGFRRRNTTSAAPSSRRDLYLTM